MNANTGEGIKYTGNIKGNKNVDKKQKRQKYLYTQKGKKTGNSMDKEKKQTGKILNPEENRIDTKQTQRGKERKTDEQEWEQVITLFKSL